MTPEQIVDLLSMIAAYDRRDVGEADVAAWHVIASEEGWTWPLARRAVIEHHKRGGDRPRIRPGHITDAIDATRRAISSSLFRRDLTPPRELRDDPHAEIAWRREYTRAATDRALDAWATGQPLPAIESGHTCGGSDAAVQKPRTATKPASEVARDHPTVDRAAQGN